MEIWTFSLDEYCEGDPMLLEICAPEELTLFHFYMLIFKQVCHRDLKLENTLLDGTAAPRLKMCDFGYSKSCSIEGASRIKLVDLNSAHDYVTSKAERRSNDPADLLIFCHGDSNSIVAAL